MLWCIYLNIITADSEYRFMTGKHFNMLKTKGFLFCVLIASEPLIILWPAQIAGWEFRLIFIDRNGSVSQLVIDWQYMTVRLVANECSVGVTVEVCVWVLILRLVSFTKRLLNVIARDFHFIVDYSFIFRSLFCFAFLNAFIAFYIQYKLFVETLIFGLKFVTYHQRHVYWPTYRHLPHIIPLYMQTLLRNIFQKKHTLFVSRTTIRSSFKLGVYAAAFTPTASLPNCTTCNYYKELPIPATNIWSQTFRANSLCSCWSNSQLESKHL